MHEHVKDLWIEGLLSGEYKQTRHVLHDGDGYCCLGVLCRILGKQFVPAYGHTVYSCGGNQVLLPISVQVEAGMKSDSGVLPEPSSYGPVDEETPWSLADLNDKGVAFDEIASLISKHWETL